MMVKQMIALVLVSSVAYAAGDKACSVARVEANSLEQVRSLINKYDRASDKDKQCHEKQMRDLLQKLTEQSRIFGQAMEAEVRGGELEASIVNEQEQVDLKQAIKLLQNKLDTLGTPASNKRKR